MSSPYIIPENLSQIITTFFRHPIIALFFYFLSLLSSKVSFFNFFIFWSTFLSLFCSTQRNKNICHFNTLNNIEHLNKKYFLFNSIQTCCSAVFIFNWIVYIMWWFSSSKERIKG